MRFNVTPYTFRGCGNLLTETEKTALFQDDILAASPFLSSASPSVALIHLNCHLVLTPLFAITFSVFLFGLPVAIFLVVPVNLFSLEPYRPTVSYTVSVFSCWVFSFIYIPFKYWVQIFLSNSSQILLYLLLLKTF